jgi:hypothetical protein
MKAAARTSAIRLDRPATAHLVVTIAAPPVDQAKERRPKRW